MGWDGMMRCSRCCALTVRTYGCSLRSPSAGDRDSEQRAGEKAIRFDTRAATRDTGHGIHLSKSTDQQTRNADTYRAVPGPLEAALLWCVSTIA